MTREEILDIRKVEGTSSPTMSIKVIIDEIKHRKGFVLKE